MIDFDGNKDKLRIKSATAQDSPRIADTPQITQRRTLENPGLPPKAKQQQLLKLPLAQDRERSDRK
jgi:hypothetical protein